MTERVKTDRRGFLRSGAAGAGALWTLSLEHFMAQRAEGEPLAPSPYGPISPKNDQATGLPLLQLPDGFRYISYSWTGDVMSDGVPCPSLHDGMAVVAELDEPDDDRDDRRDNDRDKWDDDRDHDHDGDGHDHGGDGDDRERHRSRSGRLLLIRNHEPGNGVPYVNNPAITYLADGAGGTTNLIFDARRGRWLRAWSSLAGTVRNCAGGVTPWGTWVTCEETTVPGHGWTFEVGPRQGDPTPLVDMGRMSHEALMVDPRTGYVYETEDAGNNSGFYRFVPNRCGRLARGGRLYMLAVKGEPTMLRSASRIR